MNKLLEILILTILVVAIILGIGYVIILHSLPPDALLNLRLLTNLPGAVKCWDSLPSTYRLNLSLI